MSLLIICAQVQVQVQVQIQAQVQVNDRRRRSRAALFSSSFLWALFGKGAMAKMLCLVTSILAVLLSVSDYGAVLPWVAGHADIRRFGVGANPVAADGLDGMQNEATKKRRGGIAPVAPQLRARWSRAESPRCHGIGVLVGPLEAPSVQPAAGEPLLIFDVDGNGVVGPFTDGDLILAHAFHLPLAAFTRSSHGTTRDVAQIQTYLDALVANNTLDVDGNGWVRTLHGWGPHPRAFVPVPGKPAHPVHRHDANRPLDHITSYVSNLETSTDTPVYRTEPTPATSPGTWIWMASPSAFPVISFRTIALTL